MIKLGTKPSGYVAAPMVFLYQGIFAVGWMAGVWVYSSEIISLSWRSKGLGLAVASEWIFDFAVLMSESTSHLAHAARELKRRSYSICDQQDWVRDIHPFRRPGFVLHPSAVLLLPRNQPVFPSRPSMPYTCLESTPSKKCVVSAGNYKRQRTRISMSSRAISVTQEGFLLRRWVTRRLLLGIRKRFE
jgi:hypothetical protein